MSNFVTNVILDAAVSLMPLYGRSTNEQIVYRYNVKKQLERAAPLIAAEALRQAAAAQRQQYASGRMGTITALWLEARADALDTTSAEEEQP